MNELQAVPLNGSLLPFNLIPLYSATNYFHCTWPDKLTGNFSFVSLYRWQYFHLFHFFFFFFLFHPSTSDFFPSFHPFTLQPLIEYRYWFRQIILRWPDRGKYKLALVERIRRDILDENVQILDFSTLGVSQSEMARRAGFCRRIVAGSREFKDWIKFDKKMSDSIARNSIR